MSKKAKKPDLRPTVHRLYVVTLENSPLFYMGRHSSKKDPDNMNFNCSSDGGITMTGENNPQYGKFGEEHPAHGHKHTEETKAKLSYTFSGENGTNTKLTEAKVLLIRELWATGDYLQRELAVKFNVTQKAISYIINRKSWKHI